MNRNWLEIMRIKCASTRAALTVCTDESILQRLQTGFPECFTSEERVPVPEAVIKERFDKHMSSNPNPKIRGNWRASILVTCSELKIPILTQINGGTPAPALRAQLIGYAIDTMFIPVTWEGTKCLAVCIGTLEPSGHIISEQTFKKGLPLNLIVAEYVILNPTQ